MSSKVILAIILLLPYFIPSAHAQEDRAQIIQKEMDCVDARLKQNPNINWTDVCYKPTVEPAQLSPSSKPKSDWSYDIAPEASFIKYTEHSFAKESGNMYGVNANLTYHPAPGDALNSEITDLYRFETKFSYGKVNYRGGYTDSYGNSIPEGFNGINDYMMELRLLFGKELFFNHQSTVLTPYLGAGYRLLFDQFYANKPGGYNRRIQYFYLPTGTDLKISLADNWSIDINGEFDLLIRGFVNSYLGEIGLGDVQNTQNGGWGTRGSIKLLKKCKDFNFFLEPFVRYWNIRSSRIDASSPFPIGGTLYYYPDTFFEPHNTSLEMGGKLGVEF